MTEREKLIDLIQNAVGGCARHWAEVIADHLLSNGVIVPPCKVGDVIYYIDKEDKTITNFIVTSIEEDILEKGLTSTVIQFKDVNGFQNFNYQFSDWHFNEVVFFTKEEAEKALKERSEGE